jgi:hypothetical protein
MKMVSEMKMVSGTIFARDPGLGASAAGKLSLTPFSLLS